MKVVPTVVLSSQLILYILCTRSSTSGVMARDSVFR